MQQLSLSAKVSAMCISFCFSFFLPNFGRSSTLFVHAVYNYPLPWQTFFAISFCFSFFLHNFGRSSALFVHTVYNYPLPLQTLFAISFFFSFLFAQLWALKRTLCAYYTQLQLNKYRIFFTISFSYSIPIYYCTLSPRYHVQNFAESLCS